MLDIETLLKKLSSDVSNVLRVCMPARIVSYDFKTQKVDVKLDMKELYSNGKELDYPIVSGVPVIFPISGGASITMPISVGDSCIVLFADRDITNWLLGSKNGVPDSRRTHDINDAIAIMGLRAFTDKSIAENNQDLLINYSGSKIRLKPNGNIDIISSTNVTVETGDVIVNCNNSTVNAQTDVKINCNDAIVKASDKVNVECTNATLKAVSALKIECENSSIIASNNINIECKDAYIKASNNINILSENTNIKANNDLNLICNDVKITASDNVDITAANNINIVAANNINTTSTTFKHTGDMVITGNITVDGTSKLTGAVTTEGGITNTGGNLVSNGITFETHTHTYNEPVVGSTPTAAVPSVTGSPL